MNHSATPKRNHAGWWIALGLVLALGAGFVGGAEWQRIRIATSLAEALSGGPSISRNVKPPNLTGPVTEFGSGTYEVGPDAVPGRYKTPGPGEGLPCYWVRTKDDSGSFNSMITSDTVDGPGVVTIKLGEFFKTSGDCTWSKV